jgi:isopenicillin N synthase-like dioxygenase
MTVTSHGIPENVIRRTVDAARVYFALPEEIKLKVGDSGTKFD